MVKNGYKQTEIGVLPEDWRVKPAKDLMKIETGSRNTEHKADHGQYPFFVRSQQVERIDSYHYDCEAVLTAGDGVGTGKVFHYIDGKFDAHQRVYVMSNFDGVLGKYFFYFFGQNFGAEVSKYTAKSSVDSVRRDMIAEMLIPIPLEDEQKSIYEAISDTEQLIETLEKQISKKKAIKQGAMQELLTGKRRLPGYATPWVSKKICDIAPLQRGFDLPYSQLEDGHIPVIFSNGVNAYHRVAMVNGPGVVTGRSGTIGKLHYVDGDYWPHNTTLWVTDFKGNNTRFIYYLFHLVNWTDYMTGSGVPTLNRNDVHAKVISIPKDVEEQKTIAAILSEMDADIAALEEKLTKYRQIKRGMMQQLLTGKIRLKNDVADSVQVEQVVPAKTSPTKPAHNHQFDDAVSIAAIVDAFYSDKYPLGRVKIQKLLYFLHRHKAVSVSDFKKKVAGPYADTVRYKGGEPIAKKNKYIASESSKQGTRYSKGENMAQALDYVERWGMQTDLQWLKENFLHTSRNDLELFATVDMAMCDLDEAGIAVSVESIKNLIASNKEWKAKLSKTHFSDWDIARAIKKCTELFS